MHMTYLPLLARINAVEGDYAVPRTQFEECLATARKVNDMEAISTGLIGIPGRGSATLCAGGTPLGANEKLREESRVFPYPVFRVEYDRAVAAARALLGERTFATSWAEDRAMTPEEAFAAGETERMSP
jgi:hypothetical protein